MQKRFLALLVLLLAAEFAFAQPSVPMPNTCDQAAISSYWTQRFGGGLYRWQDVCALGLLISFFMIALVYMFSQLFGKPELAAWSKKELFQAAVTGVLLAGIFGFINFSCTFIKPSLFVTVTDPAQDYLYDYGLTYLMWLRDASYRVYVYTSLFNSVISAVVSNVIYQSPGGFGVNLRPFGGLASLSSMLSFSMNAIMVGGVITTITQLRMLRAIQLMAFTILLPVGIVCRCFEPFRRFGGSMIAIAVGLYLFYPILLVLNAGVVHNSILQDTTPTSDYNNLINPTSSEGVRHFFESGDPYYYESQTSLETARDRAFALQGQTETNPFFASGNEGSDTVTHYFDVFNLLYRVLLRLLIASLFLPLFNFILLVTFIRNLSRSLGEEVDVTNITRMI